jgi:hypothetical protein
MPGIHNSRLQFERKDDYVVFTTEYRDDADNLWRMDVTGSAHTAGKFREARAIEVGAKPLSPDYIERLRENMGRSTLESQAPESRADYDQSTPSGALDRPGLIVTATLIKLVQPGPYQVRLEVDPDITASVAAQDTPHWYSIVLDEGDTWANAGCFANAGNVGMNLGGVEATPDPNMPGWKTAAFNAWSGSTWTIIVYLLSDGGANYTLRGDLTHATRIR